MVSRRPVGEWRASSPDANRRREILRESDLFSVLREPELEYALEHTVVRYVRRGQPIVQRNDAASGMHAMVEGFAKLSLVSDDGGEVIYRMVGPADWFGEVALMDGGFEGVSAIAIRPSTVLTVQASAVLGLMERNPRLALAFARRLAKHARAQERRIADIQLYDLATRLARTLVTLSRQDGDGLRMTLPLTQSDLAAMLGATRVRVNLVLGRYRDAGIIRLDNASILILSPERLRELARMP